jgi:hypothetical protein
MTTAFIQWSLVLHSASDGSYVSTIVILICYFRNGLDRTMIPPQSNQHFTLTHLQPIARGESQPFSPLVDA